MISLKPAYLKKVKKILSDTVPDCGVMVYGARAQGKGGPHSYLDLAVMGDKPLAKALLTKLDAAFSEANLPFRVETVDWTASGPAFRKEIQRTAVMLQPPPKN